MSAAAPTMGGTPAVPAAPAISVPSATGVDAHMVLAGPGARSIAFLIDWLIRCGLSIVYLLVAAWLILGNLDFEIDRRPRDAVVPRAAPRRPRLSTSSIT